MLDLGLVVGRGHALLIGRGRVLRAPSCDDGAARVAERAAHLEIAGGYETFWKRRTFAATALR